MFKRYYFTGLAAGILSGLAAFFYYWLYTTTLGVNFNALVSPLSIFSACIFAGMLIALLSYTVHRLFKKERAFLSGVLLTVITMLSMVIPFMVSLPLDMAQPELFPGLVVPMQLFPAMMWFVLKAGIKPGQQDR
ncbi:hypothetical protein [Chitinophaga agri]|uniref:Uncharacterized protein n=1 Tax=Chitinophaga agri TaxID=2703787 RepID=A0A6B9ZKW7_9BACT|nr:hypothetical protein [Chitinophaga agri]QHS63070.1 hypothetical protein GWR21_26825 [Chitinophaga agri]